MFVAPYMIPPYVGAIAWIYLMNPSVGYINKFLMAVFGLSQAPFNIYSVGGMVWCMTLFYSPFAFITISRAMEKMDPSLEEASRVAGASPLKTLCKVTLPLMLPSVIAGGVLVFINAASSFGIPAMIGMPAQIEVLTTRIVTYVYMGTGKGIREATALAVVLMVVANGLLYASTFLLGRKEYVTIGGKSMRPNLVDLGKWKWPVTGLVILYGMVSVFLPMGAILVTSLMKTMSRPIGLENLTLATWKSVVENTSYMDCLSTSFIAATAAATLATAIALLIAYLAVKTKAKGRKIPDSLATLGGATPSIVIALALIITFSGEFGLNLYSTVAILVVSYLVQTYGMTFKDKRQLDIDPKYEAIADGRVDVINAFATDGSLVTHKLVVLTDDKDYFTDYQGTTLVRMDTLRKYPELEPVLNKLADQLSDADMQRLNYQIDQEKRPIAEVARNFLTSKGLLPVKKQAK